MSALQEIICMLIAILVCGKAMRCLHLNSGGSDGRIINVALPPKPLVNFGVGTNHLGIIWSGYRKVFLFGFGLFLKLSRFISAVKLHCYINCLLV